MRPPGVKRRGIAHPTSLPPWPSASFPLLSTVFTYLSPMSERRDKEPSSRPGTGTSSSRKKPTPSGGTSKSRSRRASSQPADRGRTVDATEPPFPTQTRAMVPVEYRPEPELPIVWSQRYPQGWDLPSQYPSVNMAVTEAGSRYMPMSEAYPVSTAPYYDPSRNPWTNERLPRRHRRDRSSHQPPLLPAPNDWDTGPTPSSPSSSRGVTGGTGTVMAVALGSDRVERRKSGLVSVASDPTANIVIERGGRESWGGTRYACATKGAICRV